MDALIPLLKVLRSESTGWLPNDPLPIASFYGGRVVRSICLSSGCRRAKRQVMIRASAALAVCRRQAGWAACHRRLAP